MTDFLTPSLCRLIAALARAGGFAAIAPTLGLEGGMFRVGLAVVMTLVLLPFIQLPESAETAVDLIAVGLGHLAAGLLVGFTLRALWSGIRIASQLVEQYLGFPSVGELDDAATASVLQGLYKSVALALFFSLGGHRLVVAGLLDTASATELSDSTLTGMTETAVRLLCQACWLAARVAAPLVVSLLTTTVAVGMIARVLPEFSGPPVASPIQIFVALIMIFLSIAAIVPVVSNHLTSGFVAPAAGS